MKTVFRHELKFCCLVSEIDEIYRWLHQSPFFIKKHFPDRHINNIYFDWFDLKDAGDNLIGLSNREKVRLRWYGPASEHCAMQLEYKIKRDRMGTKKIFPLAEMSTHGMAAGQLRSQIESGRSEHGSKLADLRLRNPVLRNRYCREYFQDASGIIRITVDREQAFFSVNKRENVLAGNRVDYPVYVVEVKFPDGESSRAKSLMSGFPLRPSRHSKYLAGLARLIEHPYF